MAEHLIDRRIGGWRLVAHYSDQKAYRDAPTIGFWLSPRNLSFDIGFAKRYAWLILSPAAHLGGEK